jgi:uncharacterized delta-60 repeat protein
MPVPCWLRALSARLAPGRRPRLAFRPRLEALEDRLTPSGGLLDPTFGSGGLVTTSPVSGGRIRNVGGASVIQPDGKIVVVGSSYNEASLNTGYIDLVRYNPDGTLDRSFNKGGVVATKYGSRLSATGVALDPTSGKIVVVGGESGGVHLVRYNTNGSLDPTFNGGKGDVLVSFPGYGTFQSSGLTVQVVNGTPKLLVYGSDAGADFALVRFNLDGTLDASFGSGGHVATDVNPDVPGGGTDGERIRSAVVLPDGRILASGVGGYQYTVTLSDGSTKIVTGAQLVVARYDTAGRLDPSFGVGPNTGVPGGGISAVRDGPTADGLAIALQPDGKIVVGGSAQPDPQEIDDSILARFNPDGSLDTTFAGGGYFTIDLDDPGSNDFITAVAVQADGGIVAAATTMLNGPYLLRFQADGSPDATFGTAGREPMALSTPWGQGVTIQSDGRIVVTGSANNALGAARYLASAPQVGSFRASPNPVTSGSSTTLTASDITDGNAGATITQVAFYVQLNGSNTLLGYGTQTSPGVWTFSYTASLAPGSYMLLAQAEDNYSVFGDPFALTLTVQ